MTKNIQSIKRKAEENAKKDVKKVKPNKVKEECYYSKCKNKDLMEFKKCGHFVCNDCYNIAKLSTCIVCAEAEFQANHNIYRGNIEDEEEDISEIESETDSESEDEEDY